MEVFKHLRAIVLLPGMVTIVVPAAIVVRTGDVALGWGLQPPYAVAPLLVGGAMVGLGLWLLRTTIGQFARVGKGTLAPWDPTQKLVVQGVYRYVRNPMISGVLAILLGEAVVLGSLSVLWWFGIFLVMNATYIPLIEERGLSERFGNDYRVYKRNVPRWIPRLKPWTPTFDDRTRDDEAA